MLQKNKPCWAERLSDNRSTVCLCSSEYCDELTRIEPSFGNFVAYTTSEDGLRFQKTVKPLRTYYYEKHPGACLSDYCYPALHLDTSRLYQSVEGFGGAVTDAAAINWFSLDDTLKQYLIDAYFGKQGLEYNMIRVPIGGSDFSTHAYAYNEFPEHDVKLSNYTLAPEDHKYKLPMIRACFDAATADVHVVATPWSPPAWMKTNNALFGASQLKEEYYQTYADYYVKFLHLYAKEGVPVWGVTTTNEPTNAIVDTMIKFNSLGWKVTDQANWIANNLGPTLRNSEFKDVKILAMDDMRQFITNYFYMLKTHNPKVLDYIDGVAVHFYFDPLVPPQIMSLAVQDVPDKFIISTEACAGSFPGDSPKVDLGSWERAQLYIKDIIEDLNYNVTGWIDWNMCLDEQGGPNWVDNFVDSPIIIAEDKLKFYKQPMYYALAHFSKFIPRGSRRIHVENLCKRTVENVSFLTPYNTIVTILHNAGEATEVDLVTCHRLATVQLERNSVTTVEFVHEQCSFDKPGAGPKIYFEGHDF
ncbi:hypothetical protein ABMA27_008327 [Loxostege sticticalis]|uniref:Glucosylceramidase n=1 Tax=Loxostege sticticalis TaxID=481309 RepID=A0ABR3HAW8_LOXSC